MLNNTDVEQTLSKVKILSEKIKLNNISRNSNQNIQCLDEIINSLEMSINNKNNTDNKYLSLILKSYQNKKKHLDYLAYNEEKKALIKRKCDEKYLSKVKKDSNYSDSEVSSTNRHFEYLKEIVEDCSSLIKYYESQIGNYQLNQVSNLKSFKTDESFFVYDYSNTAINLNPPSVLEKCIGGVLQTKNECMKLLEISKVLDLEKIKKLKEQIAILEEEYNKIYPKCTKLYKILVNNKIISEDEERKKQLHNKAK